MIENENREENFISEHVSSVLEIVSTDWRPVAKLSFAKERNKDRRADQEIDIEKFISIKGVSALGNQLTKYKINQIDLIDSLPYTAPEKTSADDIVVVDEEIVSEAVSKLPKKDNKLHTKSNLKDSYNKQSKASNSDLEINDEGQITLF